MSPAERYLAAMVYDTQLDRIVLCGGITNAGYGYDGWAYDLRNNTWASASGAACGLYGAAMTYDTLRDRILMYGGGGSCCASELLAYDSISGQWTLVSRTAKPMGRSQMFIAYDPGSNQLIMFGGMSGSDLDDTWTYNFSTNRWDVLSWGTPGYLFHGLAYDAQSDRTILVAGFGCADRTWAYDFRADRWTNMKPDLPYGTSSPQRAVAYDTSLDRVICFDGRTVAYDFDSNTWTDLHANPPSNLGYPGQSGFEMAYDSESDRVILVGGISGFGREIGDTWGFDSAVWTNLTPSGSPPARSFPAIAYDSESDRIVMFGGDGSAHTTLGDTWAYDYNSNRWTNLSSAVGPSARSNAAAAYDRQSDRVVLFGGSTESGWANDTWAYDLNTNTWTNLTSGDNPLWRGYGHAMAYDSHADRTILFGGSAPNGVTHLTWGFELGSLERLRPPGSTEQDLTYVVGIVVAGVIVALTVFLFVSWRRSRKPPAT